MCYHSQYLLSNLVRKFCSSEKGSLKLIHYHCSDKRTMMRIKNTSTCNTTQALQHTVLSTIYVAWPFGRFSAGVLTCSLRATNVTDK